MDEQKLREIRGACIDAAHMLMKLKHPSGVPFIACSPADPTLSAIRDLLATVAEIDPLLAKR